MTTTPPPRPAGGAFTGTIRRGNGQAGGEAGQGKCKVLDPHPSRRAGFAIPPQECGLGPARLRSEPFALLGTGSASVSKAAARPRLCTCRARPERRLGAVLTIGIH